MTNDGRLKRVKLSFERNFTQMPNDWHRDNQLSLGARGLLGLLMSHDEGYTVSIKALAATNPEGKDAITTMTRELRAQGYLEIEQLRGRNGRLDGAIWKLTDPVEVRRRRAAHVPLAGFPEPVEPRPVYPDTANPHLKEEQLLEDLTQELNANPSTRAGMNEDASGDSHHAATLTPEQAYERYLHQPCNFRAGKEHDFTPTTPCTGCGIRIGQYWDHRGNICHLSDLLAVSS